MCSDDVPVRTALTVKDLDDVVSVMRRNDPEAVRGEDGNTTRAQRLDDREQFDVGREGGGVDTDWAFVCNGRKFDDIVSVRRTADANFKTRIFGVIESAPGNTHLFSL